MTNLIQFTVVSRWKHVVRKTGVVVNLKIRAAGEPDLRQVGTLSMTDAAWDMLQHQLCPSGYSDKCSVEIIEQESEW